MRIGYRLNQFWQMMIAPPLPPDALAAVAAVLSRPELALYCRYSRNDQQHAYRVLGLLQQAGHTHPALLTAALLHDVGKTQVPLTVWERSLVVLADKVAPDRVQAWGEGEAAGWKRPFVVKVQHPIWSARMARDAGSDPLAVWLVAHHQDDDVETADTEQTRLLRLLQWADNQS